MAAMTAIPAKTVWMPVPVSIKPVSWCASAGNADTIDADMRLSVLNMKQPLLFVVRIGRPREMNNERGRDGI